MRHENQHPLILQATGVARDIQKEDAATKSFLKLLRRRYSLVDLELGFDSRRRAYKHYRRTRIYIGGNRMKYFDEEAGAALKTAFEDEVSGWPDVTATTMFGCPSYQADGTLFAVLVTDGVALTRLPNDHREQVARTFDTGPFQAGERTVTKWVKVTVDDVDALDKLVPHIKTSYESALEKSD